MIREVLKEGGESIEQRGEGYGASPPITSPVLRDQLTI